MKLKHEQINFISSRMIDVFVNVHSDVVTFLLLNVEKLRL